jgi:hypothetical protein
MKCIYFAILLAFLPFSVSADNQPVNLEKLGYSTTQIVVPVNVNLTEVNDPKKSKLEMVPQYFDGNKKSSSNVKMTVRPGRYCNDIAGGCYFDPWPQQGFGNTEYNPNQPSNINRNMGQKVNNTWNSNVSIGMESSTGEN